MAFGFAFDIHRVRRMTAHCTTLIVGNDRRRVGCLELSFSGRDGDQSPNCTIYFDAASLELAHKYAAAIMAVNDEADEPVAEAAE